jgi:hypothetical protein
MAGSQRALCSSEPHRAIAPMARPEWTPKNVLNDPSARASSRATIPDARRESPGHPWPSMIPPTTPSSRSAGISSNGNSARSQ